MADDYVMIVNIHHSDAVIDKKTQTKVVRQYPRYESPIRRLEFQDDEDPGGDFSCLRVIDISACVTELGVPYLLLTIEDEED
jgi:hypothetical protein